MSKRENNANNVFRPSDSRLTEYEKDQIAARKNLERLRTERLAREAESPEIMSHDRPQKITLTDMRAAGVRGLLIYCSDYHCSHWTAISADEWPDDVRLSDLEPRFTCQACGRKGAEVRPDWQSVEAYAWQGLAALRPILVEGYADLLPFSPDDVTRNVRAVRLKDEVETLGDLERVGDVERRPRNGNVAD